MVGDTTGSRVILFDGECRLCNGAVAFIIHRDPHGQFRFSPFQSPKGRMLAEKAGLEDIAGGTLVLLEDGKSYFRSDAALRIARRLTGLWPLLYVFMIIPRPIRDLVYDCIAHRRYKWFGKKDSCMVPGRDIRDRFIE